MVVLKRLLLITGVVLFLFTRCKPFENSRFGYQKDKLTISTAEGESFSFHSEDPNFICLGFLNNFQDSIVVLCDNKRILNFKRHDTISYKEMSHDELFKIIRINRKRSENKIKIFLLSEKSEISFDLVEGKSLYLISRYNKQWYLTLWGD
ncbi:hypothetical protein [Flavobacterium cerinum]|uniref:Lipoprotein n=1 Tax=Flavobacterium cerinum TaxID=2502784 RepID=A0ABY5IZ27_9FLAO|nr:hypothetical protein [Flavobacterium cerinum]UUC46757.1 hypothetical protein NOX80_06035 [Flavobacterium cerinum]